MMRAFPHTTEKGWIVWLTLFSGSLLLVSLLFSPFLLSVSMWLLVAAALWQVAADWGERRFWVILKIAIRQYWQNRVLFALSCLLWVPLVSGLWSDDFFYWLERVRVRIPFVVLPFAFANLPTLTGQHRRLLWFVFIGVVAGTCAWVLFQFIFFFDEIMSGLREGRAMPVPRGNHIRFSLMVSWATVVAGLLAFQTWKQRTGATKISAASESQWTRHLPVVLIVLTVFLFVMQHVLAVRSGLAALYLVLLFLIFRRMFCQKKWLSGSAILLALGAAGWLCLQKMPSLAQKFSYMHWDWQQTHTSDGYLYSDSGRQISMLTGWELVKRHPLLGVGAGDLPQEMQLMAQKHFPNYAHAVKLPHNQFLYWWASTGTMGLALSIGAICMPFLMKRLRQNLLFLLFQIIIFSSFLTEYTLETAVGVAFFLFFQLLLITNDNK